MKKTIIALAALAFSGTILAGGPTPMAAPAPQDNMYFGFHVDMTSAFYDVSSSPSGPFTSGSNPMAFIKAGFQVGILFGAIRAEVSSSYYNSLGSGTANLSVFLKGAYNLQLGDGLSVYPVAGIGLIHHFAESTYDARTEFAYLLGAGVTLALNKTSSISSEYNWINISSDTYVYNSNYFKNTGVNIFSIRWNRTF